MITATTYALVQTTHHDDGTATRAVLRTQSFTTPPPLLPPAKGLEWLEYVDVPRPAYNPTTHGCRELDVDTSGARARRVWQVYPLPEDEALARQMAAFVGALEAHYDATAQERQYDSRLTCALRAGYPGPFQPEGLAFATWMDTCNAYAYQQLAAVQAGQRPPPASPAALVAELPAIAWPAA